LSLLGSGGGQAVCVLSSIFQISGLQVDVQSFLVGAAPQTTCSPSDLQTNQTIGGAPLLATSGLNLTAANLSFTGCN